MKLLLATHNEHKRREFERLLVGHEVCALPAEVELPPEDGETFAQNALGKARAAARATGEVAIADDSGIEAAALGGAPGVRSARYAGEHASDEENLAKLLREAPAGSALAYVCALAYVDPRGRHRACVRGSLHGPSGGRTSRVRAALAMTRRFCRMTGCPTGLTMAELADRQKDAISHRGRARALLPGWR